MKFNLPRRKLLFRPTSRSRFFLAILTLAAVRQAVTGQVFTTLPAREVIQYDAPRQVSEVTCDRLTESSGLAASRLQPDVFWTHNDSGDKPCLYAFDATGKHLGTCDVPDAEARDWEDMASFTLDGKSLLLVGDVGDGLKPKRQAYELYLIEESAPDAGTLALMQKVRFRYDRGPQDCESIGFDTTKRQVLLVSKNWTSPKSQVYVLDWPSQTNETEDLHTARFIGDINVPGATAMDISPDGLRAIVLCYGNAYEYMRTPDETWQTAFAREGREIEMPERRQGETICYGADGRTLFLTSEMQPTPFFRVAPR